MLNLRAGAHSRASGLFVGAFCLVAVFLLPNLIGYLPRPALTGLLLYLGISMLIEWTVETYRSMALLDYLLVIAILVLIAGRGFLYGVGFGVVAASLRFVISYSRLFHRSTTYSRLKNIVLTWSATHPTRPFSIASARRQSVAAFAGILLLGTAGVLWMKCVNASHRSGACSWISTGCRGLTYRP